MPTEITEVRSEQDIEVVSRLHREQLAESFLARLGERFLKVLYRRIVRDAGSTLLVARSGGRVVGFIAGTDDTHRLYRDFVRRDAFRASIAAGVQLLRSPWTAIETLRYGGGGESSDDLPPAELLSIAVSPDVRRTGVASLLIAALQKDCTDRGLSTMRVTVAADNAAAIAAYERSGFRRASSVEVHRGRRSEVLVWG